MRKPPPPPGPGPVVTTVRHRVALWPYLVTPTLSLFLFPLTLIAHWTWGDSPWTGVALTLAGVTVVAWVWRTARPRGPLVQVEAVGVAAAGAAWTIAAVIAGPTTRPLVDVWVLGTVVGSIVVAVQHGLRNGPPGGGGRGDGLADTVKALKDARLGRPHVNGSKVTARVEMPPGQPWSDVASPHTREAIASALDVPPSAVRTPPDPDSGRRGSIEIVPFDELDDLPWPGPSHPGGTIADPVVLGHYEDGTPLRLWLPGDPATGRNASHIAVVGMSGAGKTETFLQLAVEVATRRDTELWLGDRRKGAQLPQWLLDAAARTALDTPSVEAMLADLVDDVAARAALLGRAGLKEWLPTAPVPLRVVLLDEAGGLVARSDEFVELAESCRSVGIILVLGLQRATHDRISTSARANIGTWLVMGVATDTDAAVALPAEALDAGAAPWVWRNGRPGYLYAVVPGADVRRWATPARVFRPDPAGQETAVAAVRDVLGLRPPTPAGRPPARTPARRGPEPGDGPDSERLPDLGEPPDDVDPAQPIPVPDGLPRIPFTPPAEQVMPPSEARAVLVRHLHERAAAGHTVLRPAELADVLEVTGRSRPWLSGQLKELCQGPAPLLRRREDRGVYEILPPAGAP